VIEDHLLEMVADKDLLGTLLPVCRHVLDMVAALRRKRLAMVRRFARQASRAGVPHMPDVLPPAGKTSPPAEQTPPESRGSSPASACSTARPAARQPNPDGAPTATIDFVPAGAAVDGTSLSDVSPGLPSATRDDSPRA